MKQNIVIVLIIAIFIGLLWYANYEAAKYEEKIFTLSELEEGVYAHYHTVSSNVPADNYDVITVNIGGRIWNLNGDVYITYRDSDPQMIMHDYNLVHGDDMWVYIPEGTLVFTKNVGLR